MRDERCPVVIATGNPEKFEEWTEILADSAFSPVRYLGPSPDEDAPDYEGNAAIKAMAAAQHTGRLALGDDSGVAIEALMGGPGLFTRRWAEERGGFAAARREVARVALGSPAVFSCGLGWAEPDGWVVTVLGETSGRIVSPEVSGHGLEPCFAPEELDVALPALPHDVRARVHYRLRAWAKLVAVISA